MSKSVQEKIVNVNWDVKVSSKEGHSDTVLEGTENEESMSVSVTSDEGKATNDQDEISISNASVSDPAPLAFANFEFPPVPEREGEKAGSIDIYSTSSTQLDDITSEIQDQIEMWSLSDTLRASQDTTSTIPASQLSKFHPTDSASGESLSNAGRWGRRFNDTEVAYLKYVLDHLYNLIVHSALEESGVQYRNTFAWKFHVK
jgi:hypothetical protein